MKRFARSILPALILVGMLAVTAWASIDGVISSQISLNDRRTVGLNTAANLSVNTVPSITYSNGSGANQGNVLYQGSLALTSGTYALDLNGAIQDSYGTIVALIRIKAIHVKNTATTGNLTFGGGSNPVGGPLNSTGTITLPPGAFAVIATPDAAGWAVTPGTGDILNFTGTGTNTFQVVILGASS